MRRPLVRRTPEEARQERIRRLVEDAGKRELALARRQASLSGAIAGRAPEEALPETDPARLELRFSPFPTISQWISRLYQGELEWAQIDTIRRNAEYGYTEQWADFTRRMYKTDDHVLSTMMTYVGAVAGARREVLARKNVPPQFSPIAQEQADACAAMLDSLPNIERSIADLVDADFVGYAVSEIVWEPRADWLYPTDLVWMHPDRFRFSQHFEPYLWDRGLASMRGRELGLEQRGVDGLGMPLSPNKYLVHVPRMVPEYAMGAGILFAVVRPWYVKNWVTKFALSGAELTGVPRLLGKVMNSAPQVVRDELFNALSNISADGVGVIGEGTEIEILDPKMQGQGGIFDYLLKRMDAAISKAILGSTLNVEVGDTGGNRSLGESQASMTIAPRWSRSGRLIANTLEHQLFRPFLEMNRHLWQGHVFVPTMNFHIVEDDPVVDELAVNSGVVKKDELRVSRKLPPLGPENGGDELIPAAATSADASIYKSQVAIDPTAVPPNDADPVQPLPGGSPGAATTSRQVEPEHQTPVAPTGAQVSALQGILEAAKDGKLEPEAAVHAVMIAFPSLSEGRARAMVGAQVGRTFPVPVAEPGKPVPPEVAVPPLATTETPPPGGAAPVDPFGPAKRQASQLRSALATTPSRPRSPARAR